MDKKTPSPLYEKTLENMTNVVRDMMSLRGNTRGEKQMDKKEIRSERTVKLRNPKLTEGKMSIRGNTGGKQQMDKKEMQGERTVKLRNPKLKEGKKKTLPMSSSNKQPRMMTRSTSTQPRMITRSSSTQPRMMTRSTSTQPRMITRSSSTQPRMMTRSTSTQPRMMTRSTSTQLEVVTVNKNDNLKGDFDLSSANELKSILSSTELKRPLTAPEGPSTKTSKINDATQPPVSSLQIQYSNLTEIVKIPADEFEEGLESVSALRTLLQSFCPHGEVVLFRNWLLQLKNPVSVGNHLQVYVYSTSSDPLSNSRVEIKQLFCADDEKKAFFMYGVSKAFKKKGSRKERTFWTVRHNENQMSMRIFSDPQFMMEAQCCRLLEYMSTFDPRCHAVMTLAYYWATINDIRIGKSANLLQPEMHLNEPLSLQWMVIFFMCYKSNIPSPKKIQERPHDIFIDKHTGVDIGFSPVPEFAKEWKDDRQWGQNEIDESSDQFILGVLKLFKDFLEYYGDTLVGGSWILNCRYGGISERKEFLEQLEWKKESGTQIKMDQDDEAVKLRKRILESEAPYLLLVHPFNSAWKISVDGLNGEMMHIMKFCGTKMNIFLKLIEMKGVEEAFKRCGPLSSTLTFPKANKMTVKGIGKNKK